jgi:hypothetical protein
LTLREQVEEVQARGKQGLCCIEDIEVLLAYIEAQEGMVLALFERSLEVNPDSLSMEDIRSILYGVV